MSAGSLASSPGGCGAGLYVGLQAFGSPGYTTGVGDLMAVTTPEVVEDADERWFEVSFISPVQLAGNARDGWLDPTLRVAFHFERSEDLASWSHGEWLDRPSTPVPGGWEYRGRSPFPVQSLVRVGQLLYDSQATHPLDARNGPVTGITLAGVAQNLPHFPYVMPADAAQLQTDLRAVGWIGATVTAASNTDFQIAIPNVPIADWGGSNLVLWPTWLTGYGPMGPHYSWGNGFVGEFVNAAGVRTSVPRQFARLAVTTNPS